MALRLDKCIVSGWIDNRTKGTVTGELWLYGREHPVILQLDGNCWRDIAGCRMEFVNSEPGEQRNMDGVFRDQRGSVGDMTASRKVRCDVPETYRGKPLEVTNVPRIKRKSGEPTPMATCLYLEWFSQRNGRVIVETCMFDVEILGEANWSMSADEEQTQRKANADALEGFVEEAQEAFDENYSGCTNLETSDESIGEEIPGSEPTPLMRERDRTADENGNVFHPLQLRTRNFAIKLRERFRDPDMEAEEMDADLYEMILRVHTLSVKLVRPLNEVAHNPQPEAGFVVSALEQVLQDLNSALVAEDKMATKNLLDDVELDKYRKELLSVREEIHSLMQRFRDQL